MVKSFFFQVYLKKNKQTEAWPKMSEGDGDKVGLIQQHFRNLNFVLVDKKKNYEISMSSCDS